MPWQPNGTVVRDNTFHTGSDVWQQDDDAGFKIVDELHDLHDQDMADAIAQTLNLDGFNTMRADLAMGGFKVVGVKTGTLPSDGTRVDQLISSATFNEANRTLTLAPENGDAVEVIIPDSGGSTGSGTLTEISIGDGLEGTNNPITETGDIALESLSPSPEGEYSGGIGSISIDVHGRVLGVSAQAFGVDLAVVQNTNNVTITNTKGSWAVLPVATQSKAGLMSKDDKSKLDGLSNGGGGSSGTISNLGSSPSTSSVQITNSGGTNATIAAATTSRAGVMTAAQVATLNSLNNFEVNLGTNYSSVDVTITNSAGDSTNIGLATSAASGPGRPGLMSASDKEILDMALVGEITDETPKANAGVTKPEGYLWLVY